VERLGDNIERTLAAGGGGAVLALGEITAVWADAVGEPVTRQAWPLRIGRDGTLHVATSSATWAFELDRLSPEIAGRLTELLGESAPTALRFRPGPLPEPGRPPDDVEGDTTELSPPSAESISGAATIASGIDDPELREMVEKAARASLERGRSDRGF
jgi:hypothetical protein